MKSCLSRLLVILFGLLIAFVIAEIGLRLAFRSLPQGLQIALRDVRVTPFTDARLVPPPIWQADNDYQTITRPGLVDEVAYGSPEVPFTVSTYSWWNGRVGFRSPQPTDGHVDGVALGNSFTFCFTEAMSCWVNVVNRFTGMNIADLGQPVTGSVSHARIFKAFAMPVKPPLVVWQFFGNDFNDDYGLAQLNGTAKTPPDPSLAAAPPPSSPLAVWLREHSMVYGLVSALVRRNEGSEQFVDPYHLSEGKLDLWFGQDYVRKALDMTNPRNLEGEGYTRQAILETRDLVQSYGGHFMIVLMPTKEEVYRTRTTPLMGQAAIDAIAEPRHRMTDFCSEQNLNCLDLYVPLVAQANDGIQGYYARDMHLNAQGNAAVGQAVIEYLKKQGWYKP